MRLDAIAENRFGLGIRPGATATDPQGWLTAQFSTYRPAPPVLAALGSGTANAAEFIRSAAPGPADADPLLEPTLVPDAVHNFVRDRGRIVLAAQSVARAEVALQTDAPFVERLVHFWANHFAVSYDRFTMLNFAGNLEFEAIRPNVLGRFGELAKAAVLHQAMLTYLDQVSSIGPESATGQQAVAAAREDIGLNENLARELLELHTLGVDGGYVQGDVEELARALTGWTVVGLGARRTGSAQLGEVMFNPAIHEPGARRLLGRTYAPGGAAQSLAMLADLSVHPLTARHVSRKLARHFVADVPSPALIDRLSSAFLKSGGDLATVYRALIAAPESWSAAAGKFKSPWDWTISSLRALGQRDAGRRAARLVADLAQPIWRPGSPAGWGDTVETWAGSDALMRRAEGAQQLAALVPGTDARALAREVLPNGLSATTVAGLSGAESGGQAIAMLLCSPEFQRR